MHNINTNSTQNNNNNETEEYQPAKTSLQSRNEKSQTFHKKFFMIKNEARSHRTSYTTSDSIYIGNYVNKKRNGHGKLILADQSYYEGNFKDGLFDGNGYYKTKTYIYKGEFLSNKKNGKGKLEYLNKKSVYEGEFKNDMKNGYGEEKYNDGSMYKGYFVNNMKEGKGILTLKKEKNNSVYEGEFKKDKICGRGIYKWDEKKIYNGEWINNEISGFGILTENNIKHVGYFSNDKKEGYGASFFIEKGFVLLGKWVNDKMEGVALIFSKNFKEDKNNINFDDNIKNEKIVMMKEGNIINGNLSDDDINKIKNDQVYNDLIKFYKDKFIPEFYKPINISD